MLSLTDAEIKLARKQIKDCAQPLIFYDDDPDGLSSFLLLYKKMGEAKGIPIKTTPRITSEFIRYIEEHRPDRLFILDIAMVDQDFIDECKVPITWIDHHQIQERKGVTYFNPRKNDISASTSKICFDIVEENEWIATIGIVADWFLPDNVKNFEYPELLPPDTNSPEQALFGTKIGELTSMFSFMLKGKMSDVRRSIKLLIKIKDPEELYYKQSETAEKLWKRFEPIMNVYKDLLKQGLETTAKDGVLEVIYPNNKWSFTKELSNEIYYHNSDKFVVVGRETNGSMKLSLRWNGNIPPILERAMEGLKASGGGHEHACGAVVDSDDYHIFIKRIRENLYK